MGLKAFSLGLGNAIPPLRSAAKKVLVAIFFFFTLSLGLSTYSDYGVSWDEPIQRQLGLATWDYVFAKRDTLHNMINQYYNPAIEFIEVLPEKVFKLESERDIYFARHAITYFIFWIGSIFLFLIVKRIFRSYWLGVIAVLLLYLTPRIYAHAFYNSKDIPLLAFFIICSYFLIVFLQKPSYWKAIILAATCGFLFGIRIVGIILPACVIGFFIFNILMKNLKAHDWRYLALFTLIFPLALYVFYPVMWQDPLYHISFAFKQMSAYPFEAKVFFMGKYLYPKELPWYYVPVWMGITIPVVWQLLFVFGLISIVTKILIFPRKWKNEWPALYLVAWFFIPWLVVLVLNAHIYDEWRHLFFIYPAFILITIYGLYQIFYNIKIKTYLKAILKFSVVVLICWQIAVTSWFMIENHPYQFIYFNQLAGKDVAKRFELDYWGLSYRSAWEFLLNHDKADPLKVQWQNDPGEFNLLLFAPEERKRVVRAKDELYYYFLTNHRLHPEYPEFTEKEYSLNVDGIEIMTIYKGPPHHEK